jgi:hypothetical protein
MSKESTLAALQSASNSSAIDEVARISQLTGAASYEGLRRGALETNLIGAGRRLTEMGQAGKQLYTMGAEALGFAEEGSTAAYTDEIRKEAEMFARTPYASGGTAGQVLADIVVALPALVVAGPAVTTLRGAAALGAMEGLSRPAYTQQDLNLLNPERVQNVASSALAATAGTYLVNRLVPSATMAIHEKMAAAPFSIEKMSLEGVQASAAREAVESARLFNTWATPGEATKDLLVNAREAGLKLFGKNTRGLYEKVIQREDAIQESLGKILSGITPEGQVAARQSAAQFSDTAYRTPFPLMRELIDENPIMAEMYKQVTGNARREFVRRSGGRINIQPGTVGELHLMRMALDDTIKAAKTTSGAVPAGLAESRNFLLGVADTFSPEYAMSRSINQRLMFQDKLTDVLRKTKDSDITSDNFYKAFLSSEAKRDSLFKEIDNITEQSVSQAVRQNIEAITPLLRAVNDSPLYEALGIRKLDIKGQGVGGFAGIAINFSTALTKGVLDRHIVEFITSPTWIDSFAKRAANKSATQKNRIMLQEFLKYLGRTAPVVASSLNFAGATERLEAQRKAP